MPPRLFLYFLFVVFGLHPKPVFSKQNNYLLATTSLDNMLPSDFSRPSSWSGEEWSGVRWRGRDCRGEGIVGGKGW